MPNQWANLLCSAEVAGLELIACLAIALLSRVVRGKEALDEAPGVATNQTSQINFARDVQPILASKCIRCHGPETREAGLRLDDRKVATSNSNRVTTQLCQVNLMVANSCGE